MSGNLRIYRILGHLGLEICECIAFWATWWVAGSRVCASSRVLSGSRTWRMHRILRRLRLEIDKCIAFWAAWAGKLTSIPHSGPTVSGNCRMHVSCFGPLGPGNLQMHRVRSYLAVTGFAGSRARGAQSAIFFYVLDPDRTREPANPETRTLPGSPECGTFANFQAQAAQNAIRSFISRRSWPRMPRRSKVL